MPWHADLVISELTLLIEIEAEGKEGTGLINHIRRVHADLLA